MLFSILVRAGVHLQIDGIYACASAEHMKSWIVVSNYINFISFIKKGHLDDCISEKDCCLWLTFGQPVRKPSSESRLDSP